MYSYFNILKQEFDGIEQEGDKIILNDCRIKDVLYFCKRSPDLLFDTLLTIIAVDYSQYIELIYPLMTSVNQDVLTLSMKINDTTDSVVEVFPSAYFDECEVFDLFGVKFVDNPNLKRLFMPESWQGHPLKKNYIMADERLSWNE